MRKYVIWGTVILSIGLAPYIDSPFNYRGVSGSVCKVNGIQYDYILVDRTHYQSPKVLIYPADRVRSHGMRGLDILVNGEVVEFGDNRVMLLKPDNSIVGLGWNKAWFVTSKDFRSGIYGIFGPVPHFKKYQLEHPRAESIASVIKEKTT